MLILQSMQIDIKIEWTGYTCLLVQIQSIQKLLAGAMS